MPSTPAPNLPLARQHLSAALAHHQNGQLGQARPLYESALRLAPALGQAHHFLGILELQSGRIEQGRLHLENALPLLPADAGLRSALGNACIMSGQAAQALVHFDQALRLAPGHPGTLSNRAQALLALGRPAEALDSARQSLSAEPGVPATLNLMAHALRDLARHEAAIDAYRQVLASDARSRDSWTGLGLCLARLDRHDEAIEALRHAVELDPADPLARQNLGVELHEAGRLAEARQMLESALALAPDDASAHDQLAITMLALGQTPSALALQARAIELAPDDAQWLSHHLFTLTYEAPAASDDPDRPRELAQRFGALLASQAASDRLPPLTAHRGGPQRPLKVGLVSGDFNEHPVAHFLMPLLPQVDGTLIELHAISTRQRRDRVTERLARHLPHWTVIEGLDDAAATNRIRQLGIDILIDLSGHTAHHRLGVFARRAAPLQLSWLGYLATTGVQGIDHVLVDALALPPELDAQFTERPWRVPGPLNCMSRPDQATSPPLELPVQPLPALRAGHLTLGCFQALPKVSDASLHAWSTLLKAMPDVRLHVQNRQLDAETSRSALMSRMIAHGIDPARVHLAGSVASRQDYLRAVGGVDIMLDTWPYNGITTTCEALWMGVPVLTLAGRTLLSRQGVSLLSAAGLHDWIAQDEPALTERLRHHARDLEALARCRGQLRERVQASDLFDPVRVAARWQQALLDLWTAPD